MQKTHIGIPKLARRHGRLGGGGNVEHEGRHLGHIPQRPGRGGDAAAAVRVAGGSDQ